MGYETAKILSPHHTVIICSPDRRRLKEAAKELKCDFEVCDVSNDTAIQKAIKSVIKKYGKIDVLVNNAGIWIEGKLEDNKPSSIKRTLEVNTLGTILLSRAVIPHLKKAGEGTILNIISQAGLYGKEERSVYNASKFAITGFTKSLEMELKKYGIRVIGFYPSFMKTKLFEKTGVKKNFATALNPAEVAKVIKFVLESDQNVVFPEVGIKRINN